MASSNIHSTSSNRSSPFELIVTAVRAETPLIRSVTLARADGTVLPALTPGAHLKVVIPGLADPRHYSLIRLATDAEGFRSPTSYRLGIRMEDPSRGGSVFMHRLKVGDRLSVAGPDNDFPLHDPMPSLSAPTVTAGSHVNPVVLLAGGIGITPLSAMAAALSATSRPYVLHYSGRSRDQLAFQAELATLAGDALVIHADDEPISRLELPALLDGLAGAGPGDLPHLYVCGPKGLIDAVIEGARQRAWPADRVHFEFFTVAAPQAGDQAFEVQIRSTGQVLTVPADKTIVDVLEAAGLDPMYDCKRGECGVCQTTVIEGQCDHRDYVLTDSEKASNTVIQICISRARSARLVLDL